MSEARPGPPPEPHLRVVDVRPARPEELPRIWEMILALATYERLRHEVIGSPERLREHLFGPTPRVECLVAERGKALVGYALYYPTYSSFQTAPMLWLEDLYVEPEHRGAGAGRALLAELARVALARGCARIGWIVLDWNQPAADFYLRLGGRPAGPGWLQYGFDRAALEGLAESRGEAEAADPDPARGPTLP